MGKVILRSELSELCNQLKRQKKITVFTNGCFDILHRGHVEYLSKAKQLGDVLFVGVNSDSSMKRIKGEKRPIIPEDDRSTILAHLNPVDYVVLFEEDTPQNLIAEILPNVLVKGADWNVENIVGKNVVEANGGRVATIELVANRSTTNIIERVLERYR